jgi:hypothetical protein
LLLGLPLHKIDIIYINGFSVSVKGNDYTQTDGRFRSGHGHNKKDEDLTIYRVQLAGKGNEGQVSRVQHQFDTHKDDDCIFSGKNSPHANTKEYNAQYEVM